MRHLIERGPCTGAPLPLQTGGGACAAGTMPSKHEDSLLFTRSLDAHVCADWLL